MQYNFYKQNITNNNSADPFKERNDIFRSVLYKYSDGIGKIIPSDSLYLFKDGAEDIVYSMFDADVRNYDYDVMELLYRLKKNTNEFIAEFNRINRKYRYIGDNPMKIALFKLAWKIIYAYVRHNNLLREWCTCLFDEYVAYVE